MIAGFRLGVAAKPRCKRSGRFALAAAIALFAGVLAARAQDGVTERQLKAVAGRDVRVAIYTDIRPDCSLGPLPAIRLAAAPAHGSVTVKRAMLKATNLKQCLAIEAPAYVAFYRAAAGFSGADVFELEITMPDGRKRRERVKVTVTNSPNAGQAI
jgi:hypothetical protein